jgi:hypothetical protein
VQLRQEQSLEDWQARPTRAACGHGAALLADTPAVRQGCLFLNGRAKRKRQRDLQNSGHGLRSLPNIDSRPAISGRLIGSQGLSHLQTYINASRGRGLKRCQYECEATCADLCHLRGLDKEKWICKSCCQGLKEQLRLALSRRVLWLGRTSILASGEWWRGKEGVFIIQQIKAFHSKMPFI